MRLRNIFKLTKHDENGKEPSEGKISRQELYVFGACIVVIAGLLIFTFGNTDKPDANTADISSISSSSESEFSSELRISSSVDVVASNSPVLSSADYSSTVSKVDTYEIKYDYEINQDDLQWYGFEKYIYDDDILYDKEGAKKTIVAFAESLNRSFVRIKTEDYKTDFYGNMYTELEGKKIYINSVCFESYYKNGEYYYEAYDSRESFDILTATKDRDKVVFKMDNRDTYLYDAKRDTLNMIGFDHRLSNNEIFSEDEKYVAYALEFTEQTINSESVFLRDIEADKEHLLHLCKEETHVNDLAFFNDTLYAITSDAIVAIDINTRKVVLNLPIKTKQGTPYRCGNYIVNLDFILDMSTGKVTECECDFVRNLKISSEEECNIGLTILSSDFKYAVTPLWLNKTMGHNSDDCIIIVSNLKTGKCYTYNLNDFPAYLFVINFEGKTLKIAYDGSHYSLNLPSLP